jgi:hypothetical protein
MDEIIFHELAIFGAEDNVPHFKNNELISKGDQHLLSDRKDKHLEKGSAYRNVKRVREVDKLAWRARRAFVMKCSQERSRKWIDFPNFTSFLLNPLVNTHEEISATSHFASRTEFRIGYADPDNRKDHERDE